MECNVCEERKIVEIWLTKAEKGDAQLRESLKPMLRQYKARKYTVVIFESGTQDLVDVTAGLLTYNRRRLAELEMMKEKTEKAEELRLFGAG